MSDGLFTVNDFISKIDWEGGVYGALEYGLTTRDYALPKHIKDKWNEIREQFADLDELVQDWYEETRQYEEE